MHNGSEVMECTSSGFEAEMHSFNGDQATIVKKASELSPKLRERRAFIFAVDTEDGYIIHLYERKGKDSYEVREWKGKGRFQDMIDRMMDGIHSSKGMQCSGETCKHILSENESRIIEKSGSINADEALSTAITSFGSDPSYLRGTVFILC